ncbi:Pyridoxamine 5'-phosphate oxidase [Halogranum gelatinilyticum]|uniref:Pyridoxamine 5'-phosphate oxidase n=1 Tax=Halogranum gelatinilyticum TaxID=660521 RepID=A0A1G9X5Q0_9EURY|nr:pyridoxamine 5'-phosphate oxidase family protein [Halogranum gelatinilyticum]SDM91663.1 Pyridoxamine 5'-phosphate oxidase [Halogranum gelatinilyticum]
MDTPGVEMTEAEIGAFLERQGHGVLSFGGETPYGLPVSFGYDVFENRCILQLVFTKGSRKQSHLNDSNAVHLTVYEWDGIDDWTSVLVDGHLSPIESSPDVVDAAEIFAEFATMVGFSVFDQTADELEPQWYELTIDEMSGRTAPALEVADETA